MNELIESGASVWRDRRNWLQRKVARLFPPNMDKWPRTMGSPATPHGITTDTLVVLDLRDRLRLLLGGRLRVEVITMMDVKATNTHSVSALSIQPPKWTEPHAR